MADEKPRSEDLLALRMRPGDSHNREWALASGVYYAMLEAAHGLDLKATFIRDSKHFHTAFEAWESESPAFARAEDVVREFLREEAARTYARKRRWREILVVIVVLGVGYPIAMYAAGWFFSYILTPERFFGLFGLLSAMAFVGYLWRAAER